MSGFWNFLKGKKTYITMGATFVCAGLSAVGVPIPEFVFIALGALGVTTLRAGVAKAEETQK